MAVTNKAIAAAKRNIADYKREFERAQAVLNDVEKEFGGNYDIRLKVPLKDPSKVTPRQARRGIERIQNILGEQPWSDVDRVSRFVVGIHNDSGIAIPGSKLKRLGDLLKAVDEINYRNALFYKDYGEKLGWKMEAPIKGSSAPTTASIEAADRMIKALTRRVKFSSKHAPGETSKGSRAAFVNRMKDTINFYPNAVRQFMEKELKEHSLSELEKRFNAYYHRDFAGKRGSRGEWYNVWYQAEAGDYSNISEFLVVMGMDKANADKVEDYWYNGQDIASLNKLFKELYN